MELQFTQTEKGFYVAEFEATADFNLHVEHKAIGQVLMYQSTGTGDYALIEGVKQLEGKTVFDYDFTALVYPKRIKIVSMSEPTYAIITTDGEVTEYKVQSKSVEVTANGSMVVTPDAGFAYLDAVTVKTNVPSQGGGEGKTLEYLDVSSLSMEQKNELIPYVGILIRMQNEGEATIQGIPYLCMVVGGNSEALNEYLSFTTAVAVDKEMLLYKIPGHEMSVSKFLEDSGLLDTYNSLPRITEEEFYNIN